MNLANSAGVCLLRLFTKRSDDSSFRMLLNDGEIAPVKALLDKLRMYNDLNPPISSGICPLNLLHKKLIAVKIVKIFTNKTISMSLLTTVIES